MSGIDYTSPSVHKSDLRRLESLLPNIGSNLNVQSISAQTFTSTFAGGKLDFTGLTLSGTSGSVAGQHIQIRVNGVDYKIELKNV